MRGRGGRRVPALLLHQLPQLPAAVDVGDEAAAQRDVPHQGLGQQLGRVPRPGRALAQHAGGHAAAGHEVSLDCGLHGLASKRLGLPGRQYGDTLVHGDNCRLLVANIKDKT